MILGWKEQFIVARKHEVTKPSTFAYASENEKVSNIPLRFSVEPFSSRKCRCFNESYLRMSQSYEHQEGLCS